MIQMKKFVLYTLILLLLATCAGVFGILLPYNAAETTMADTGLILQEQEDGTLSLQWPEAKHADRYQIEILARGEVLYREFSDRASGFPLPELPENTELTLRIQALADYRTLLGEGVRSSDNALEAVLPDRMPRLKVLSIYPDAGEQSVTMVVDQMGTSGWQCRVVDESGKVLLDRRVTDPFLVIPFGEQGPALPEENAPYQLQAMPVLEQDGLLCYGPVSRGGSITLEDLTVWELTLQTHTPSKYKRTFTWNEVRRADYAVQRLEQGDWITVSKIFDGEARSYTTPWLNPGSYEYRIVALDDSGTELAVTESQEVLIHNLTQYATVWPVMDIHVYNDPNWIAIADHVKQGQAFCVLEEVNGLFAIEVNGKIRYINSNYCMINLPDYMGDLCSYNITNSVSSIYAVHEFGIPDVTGVVSLGYEDIAQENGDYLVPLLYPTAKKLMKAARTAQNQGYRLKIYDSFRPYITTRDIFDRTELILDEPLPQQTYTGLPRSAITDLPEEPKRGFEELTYGWVMMGYNYGLNAFLARNGSSHNFGIALDLTLEDLISGEEIPMQTSMHDLSQYSVLSTNNDAANLLGSFMKKAGFGGLVSEWWHFQDNDARDNLDLVPVINGVSSECWVKDDQGWRWRDAKGSFFTGKTLEIGNKTYTFNADGYRQN